MRTSEEMASIVNEDIVTGSNRPWDFKVVCWYGALLSGKCCCFVWILSWKSYVIWTKPSEEEEETFWPSGGFLVWYFHNALLHHWGCSSWKHSQMNGILLQRFISLLFLRFWENIIYCVSALSLHIEST